MSHVDDGELTAYADGAYPAGERDALRISAHLSACDNCRNRLEQAQMLRDRASEILGLATPAARATPSFEALEAQVATSARQTHRNYNLAWAATIILALGLGWFGRGAWQNPPARTASIDQTPARESQAQLEEFEVAREPTATPGPQVSVESHAAKQRAEADMHVSQPANAVVGNVAGQGAATIAAAPAARDMALAETVIVVPHVADLPVARVVTGDTTIVEQTLPDGKLIRLAIVPDVVADAAKAERREQAPPPAAPTPAPARARAAAAEMAQMQKTRAADVTVRVNGKLITITGDVSADSLRALGAKIK